MAAIHKISALAMLALFPKLIFPQEAQPDPRWIVTPNLNDLDGTNLPPSSTALVKSLSDAAEYVQRWKVPGDAEDWMIRRREVERAFRHEIGLENLPPRTPLNGRTTGSHDFGDYVLENVIFESRPGFPVTANLYRPKDSSRKRAAVLCPIGHELDAGKAGGEIQARCIKLAKLGFVVLVYDAIGQGERMVSGNIHHEAGYALLPLGETIAGWMVWDSMRAIDYLQSLPDVDPERIGVTGNSGGGLNTLFTAALDHRVRASAVAGYTFEFSNWLKYAGAHCTCTQLPGLFRSMEWFEIAGLIAPRPLLMLQGDHDDIFPISGARRSAARTEAIYALLQRPWEARFDEVPQQPHSYGRPYRERMYGWMALHLQGIGNGDPIPEGDVAPLSQNDPRLRCDPAGAVVSRAPTVLSLARARALDTIARRPTPPTDDDLKRIKEWARDLAAPPESKPHLLKSEIDGKIAIPGGRLEKLFYVSEDGEYIPALLWLPAHTAGKTVVIADGRGKAAVAVSGLVEPLLAAGITVFSPDLRGRGETLGKVGTWQNNNFRLTGNQILFGRPLAGRRAFDLIRGIDYLQIRPDVSMRGLTVAGIGGDGLSALLAAAADDRIRNVAVADFGHSFVSLMKAMASRDHEDMVLHWNSAERLGTIQASDYSVDLGSVVPYSVASADIPELVLSIAPRNVLYCQAPDHDDAAAASRLRFQRLMHDTGARAASIRYESQRKLDATLLLGWLRGK
ncbi:MAG TPA: acetylxylan esterase [Bryobacteraceae bacterium]|nr:acetylxylan esterase [Bryobacteraceae bacterium]